LRWDRCPKVEIKQVTEQVRIVFDRDPVRPCFLQDSIGGLTASSSDDDRCLTGCFILAEDSSRLASG
jgi:hypothetical protein